MHGFFVTSSWKRHNRLNAISIYVRRAYTRCPGSCIIAPYMLDNTLTALKSVTQLFFSPHHIGMSLLYQIIFFIIWHMKLRDHLFYFSLSRLENTSLFSVYVIMLSPGYFIDSAV